MDSVGEGEGGKIWENGIVHHHQVLLCPLWLMQHNPGLFLLLKLSRHLRPRTLIPAQVSTWKAFLKLALASGPLLEEVTVTPTWLATPQLTEVYVLLQGIFPTQGSNTLCIAGGFFTN